MVIYFCYNYTVPVPLESTSLRTGTFWAQEHGPGLELQIEFEYFFQNQPKCVHSTDRVSNIWSLIYLFFDPIAPTILP